MILKWVGNKQSVTDKIIPYFDLPAIRVFEPFVGSGAVSLALQNYPASFIFNDVNSDLINLWHQIIYNRDAFSKELVQHWECVPNTEENFYTCRNSFNERVQNNLSQAASFVWLNRHCYNGLCRYNRKGEFNSPYGFYKNPKLPEVPVIKKPVTLHNLDYLAFFDRYRFTQYDLIYVDPPYVKANAGQFTSYAGKAWTDKDDEVLAETLFKIRKDTFAQIYVSNSDTQRTKELYAGGIFFPVHTRRSVAADPTKRGVVCDWLIKL